MRGTPIEVVTVAIGDTDKLKNYGAAHRMTMPGVDHSRARYENS